MIHRLATGILAVIVCAILPRTLLAADPVPAQTRLVALPSAPAVTEKDFTIGTAQDISVTLTDFELPAAFASASVLVTQGDAVVGKATLAPPSKTATVAIAGATGRYTVRVIGEPDSANSIGFFGVCVAPTADPANCIQSASFSGNVSAAAATADPTLTTLSLDLQVQIAGAYTISFADHLFPAPLSVAPGLALFQGSNLVLAPIASGTVVNLNAGSYRLYAYAQADPAAGAGLFGITINGPSTLLDDSFSAGTALQVSSANNSASQNLFLAVADFGFPTSLAGVGAAATVGGTAAAVVASGGGAVSFQAPATTPGSPLKIWSYATAGTGAGTYSVDLTNGSASLYSQARGVRSGSSTAFAFATPVLASGTYAVSASDFEFPSALQQLSFAVYQNGAIIQQSNTAGTLNVSLPGGSAILLVGAKTPASGNGLFDINVQTIGTNPQLLFDQTRGVASGSLFDTQEVILGIGGGFDVSFSDLKFPGQFQDLALVVSSGGTVLGKIFGGGTFNIAATPGTYQLTFIATPAAQSKYGLYALKMTAAPPAVTLSATPTTLVEGESSTLNWTVTEADSCGASGGNWSGSKSVVSGSEVVKVDTSTTYTLTCVGAGGSTAKTVTVTATAKPAASKGGGGAVDDGLLIALALIWIAGVAGARVGGAATRAA